jgi:2-phosphoglycerate kinase
MSPLAPIIVLIGAPGVGKSTLAHSLRDKLHVMHGAGVSVILYTLRALKPKHPALKQITILDPKIPLASLRRILFRQARYLAPAVNLAIKTYAIRGVPALLEGRHIFPPFLKLRYVTLCVAIAAPPKGTYNRWLNSPKSKRRSIPHPLELGEKINKILIQQARRTGIPIIRELNHLKRLAIILRLLRRHRTQFSAYGR